MEGMEDNPPNPPNPPTSDIYCSVCLILCRPEQWRDRQNGQKHRKKLAQQAAGGDMPDVAGLLRTYQYPPPELADKVRQTAEKLKNTGVPAGPTTKAQHIRWAIWELCRMMFPGQIQKSVDMFEKMSEAVNLHYRSHHKHPQYIEEVVRLLSTYRALPT